MDRINAAFHRAKRENFLPDPVKGEAAFDVPVPIGFGQTNSQPTVVQLMLEWLDPRPGHKVLDVGSGSGWTTALLAYLVSPGGMVYAAERIPELLEFGRQNCVNTGVNNAYFFEPRSGFLGLPEKAPFDRILVSASAPELPEELVDQLSPHGKMVVPVKTSVLEVTKQPDGRLEISPHSGFMFVPLV